MLQNAGQRWVVGAKPTTPIPEGPKVYAYLKDLGGNAAIAVNNSIEAYPEAPDWLPDTRELVLREMRKSLDLMHRLAWAVALTTRDIAASTQALGLSEAEHATKRLELAADYVNELQLACAELGIGPLAGDAYVGQLEPGIAADGIDRFFHANPEANVLTKDKLETVNDWYRPFICASHIGYIQMLPIAGRALMFSMLHGLGGNQVKRCPQPADALRTTSPECQETQRNTMLYLAEATVQVGFQGHNLSARFRLQTFAILLLSAVLAALQLQLTAVRNSLSSAEQDIPESTDFPDDDGPLETRVFYMSNLVASRLVDNDPILGQWTLDPTAAQSVAPGVNHSTPMDIDTVHAYHSNGSKFLQDMTKHPKSQYRMPAETDSQADWEAWFDLILEFLKDYPDTPVNTLVGVLTNGVKRDNLRIRGWSEKRDTIPVVTPVSFLDHVRGQILPTVTTRHVAWDKLKKLSVSFSSERDCLALSNTIKTLAAQIYPPAGRETDESDPVSRNKVLLQVARILDVIKLPKYQTPLCKAWRGADEYSSSKMFTQYLDSALHREPKESENLFDAYLIEVTRLLEAAHKRFTHFSELLDAGPADKERVLEIDDNSDEEVLFAGKRGPDRPKGAAKKRTRGTGGKASGSKPITPPDPSKVIPPAQVDAMSGYSKCAYELGLEYPELQPGGLRKDAGDKEYDRMVIANRLSRGDCCYICLELTKPNGHLSKDCPYLTNPAVSFRAKQLYKEWRTRVNKLPRGPPK